MWNSEALNRQLEILRNNGYLALMRDEPSVLYTNLRDKVRSKTAEYENMHPAGTNPLVRMIMKDIIWHTRVIDENTPVHSVRDVSFIHTHPMREKYYALAGVLWASYRRVESQDKDFSDFLTENFISPTIVDEVDAAETYNRFRSIYADKFHDERADTLYESEKVRFHNAAYSFGIELASQPPTSAIYKPAQDLLNTFNEVAKKAEKKNDKKFDFNYHAILLEKAKDVLQAPFDKDKLESFRKLAIHNQAGKPSLAKQVAGVVFMFIGVASIAVGIGMAIATWGFGSHLSIGCIAGGAKTIVSGIGFFHHGRERAQEKVLQAYCRAG